MILGSLKSPQRALQEYEEKHHCPTMEDNTKWGKVWPLYKEQPVKPLTPKMQQVLWRSGGCRNIRYRLPRIIRSIGLSDPDLCQNIRLPCLQRLHFWEGYKNPSTYLQPASFAQHVFSLSPTIVDLGQLASLSIPPMILAYLWGKRERRSRSTFPPIHLPCRTS